MLRKLSPLFASLIAAIVMVSAYQVVSIDGPGARVTASEQVAVIAPPAQLVVNTTAVRKRAAASKPRHRAMRFAISKRGGWYRYGGNGPSSYDCSGLVMAAYKSAGIYLPRVASSQRSSGRTVPVAFKRARWGDLVFWGPGHVEFFGHRVYRNGRLVGFVSFGAHKSGTRISYRTNYFSSSYTQRARAEYVSGAGSR